MWNCVISSDHSQKNTFDPFNLNELLQELPRKQKEVLWERLTQLMTESLMENPVETWQRVKDNENNDDMEVERVPEMVKILSNKNMMSISYFLGNKMEYFHST